MHPKKILVIDDEHEMAILIKANLEKEGYIVDYALNGVNGIEKAKKFKPDLITLDILMPDMNGLQVLEEIKHDPLLKDIPVFMLSIVSEDSATSKFEELGAEKFISKPIDFCLLSGSIEKTIGKIIDAIKHDNTVLIIDDEEAMADMTSSHLSKEGYKVLKAIGGQAGLSLAKRKNPDIIVLDLNMPALDGFEVITGLKNEDVTKNIPVIIYTSSVDDSNKRRALELGAAAFIDKHENINKLLENIKEILEHDYGELNE